MLIEFTGPSASGKSTLAKKIVSELDNAYLLTPSSLVLRRAPFRLKLINFRYILSNIHKGFTVFVQSFLWERQQNSSSYFESINYSLINSIRYCILTGAKKSNTIYVRDQGVFQLGSWLPKGYLNRPDKYYSRINKFKCFPDILINIDISPKLSNERLIERNDFSWGESNAKKRGFSSFIELCEFEKENEMGKLNLAKLSGAIVLNIEISEQGKIAKINDNYKEVNCSTDEKYLLDLIETVIRDSWVGRIN